MKKKIKSQTTAIMAEMEPRLCVTSEKLKEIKDWEVGETYTLDIEVEMVGKRKTPSGEYEGEFFVKKAYQDDDDEYDDKD